MGPSPRPRASSPAELADHLEDGLDHLLDQVDATDEQREQASAIAERRAPELFAVMTRGRGQFDSSSSRRCWPSSSTTTKLEAARAQLNVLATKASAIGLDSVYELAAGADARTAQAGGRASCRVSSVECSRAQSRLDCRRWFRRAF